MLNEVRAQSHCDGPLERWVFDPVCLIILGAFVQWVSTKRPLFDEGTKVAESWNLNGFRSRVGDFADVFCQGAPRHLVKSENFPGFRVRLVWSRISDELSVELGILFGLCSTQCEKLVFR